MSVQSMLRAGAGTGKAVASQSCNFLLLYKFYVGNVK